MKPPQKELIADGNRQKPPRSKSVPSTTSSDACTLLGDVDDEISTSASESYPQEESSSNEDNSTCCDEDFTWVCNQKEKIEMSPTQNAHPSKATVKHSAGNTDDADGKNSNQKRGRHLRPSGSLDRRRIHSRNRQERDSKSRSAHSLQESSATSTTDYASPEHISGFHRPKRTDFIPKYHNKHHPHMAHYNAHRPKMPPPIFWERPYFPSWDSNVHYANYHTQDDNYYDEYYNHRAAHNDCCRYDSDTNININKPKLMSPPPASPSNYGAYCSNRFYTKPTLIQQQQQQHQHQHQQQPHQCYSCERSTSSIAIPNAATSQFNKRQSEGSDERLRLLQNDKELLAHQVHMLSEQVSAQNEKINDLERLITDKAQHVSTTEDLLQRVCKKN
ncbi:uncharacterized protein LOC129571249 isoform X2 [Sitodiplosis mosellana]|uniref:uncharacterized protein LOC129571249 isoform X2 n=1 Tax=Sitodiplosis mosellana TaxID=263140 RepID=UPI0024444044|nr:uncharacterized protein LOC129571249 isoform X2 [Sitodiplosis mosellana]